MTTKKPIETILHWTEGEPADKRLFAADELPMPSLDKRAEVYLTALHGHRAFSPSEYASARKLLADKMAAQVIPAEAEIPAEPTSPERGTWADKKGVFSPQPGGGFAEGDLPAYEALHPVMAQRVLPHQPASRLHAQRKEMPVLPYPRKVNPESKYRRLGIVFSVFGLGIAVGAGSLFSFMDLGREAPPTTVAVWPKSDARAPRPAPETRVASPRTDPGPKRASVAPTETSETLAATVHLPTRDAIPDRSPVSVRLLNLGRLLVDNGDIPAGQLVLNEAVLAGSAEAALFLGGLFDPVEIQRLGLKDLSPDSAVARAWYEKARELGSPEAHTRLSRLR